MVENAFLVGITRPETTHTETELLLQELAGLVETLGIRVAGRIDVRLSASHPRLLIGSGKAREIITAAREAGCDCIVFDEELSPAQQRNWDGEAGDLLTIDRHEIILDIFAARATTREARLQVQLARMEYNLPRLRRAWTHLGRQRGGVNQRGEGETQLEVDHRLVRKRISRVKEELTAVARHREVQRKKRMSVPVPTGAIVGYTNAGKSSLLNALTHSQVVAEDKLFATLDPTSRRLNLPNGQNLVLTDTVGFVRKLPHGLIESFKATLEEAIVADFLIHVIDVSSDEFEEHWKTTDSVLEELGAADKPTLLVFNKVDRITDTARMDWLRLRFPDAYFVSVKEGLGLEALREEMERTIVGGIHPMRLLIPHDRYDIVHFLHEIGAVRKETYEAEGIVIRGEIPEKQLHRISSFAIAS